MDNYRQLAWDMYFSNLVAIQFHPANHEKTGDVEVIINNCAAIADQMLVRRDKQCLHG